MAKEDIAPIEGEEPATAGERRLRGEVAQSKEETSREGNKKIRNVDTEIRLDGESDTLYNDGLHIGEDESLQLFGTHGDSWGIKP